MQRKYPENELLTRPDITVRVGLTDADIMGPDHRALQAALDYVAALGGGTVEIGPGEYLMRDSLHVRSGVTVRGQGEKTVLRKGPSVTSRLTTDGDFGEEAITVEDGTGFGVGCGVHVMDDEAGGFHRICATILNRDGNYLTLSRPLNANCMLRSNASAATIFPVISAYQVQDFRIENLTIDGNREQNDGINGCRGAGIFFYRGDAAVVENCLVRDYNGDGISFQQSNDVQILNCLAENNAVKGLHPGSGSQRPVVRGCRAAGNGADGFFFCWRVRNALVEDNELLNNEGYGMSIGHKDSDNLVRRNRITGNAKGGVLWRKELEPIAPHRIEFVENVVEDNEEAGLLIEGPVEGTVLLRNTIRDTGKGVQKIGIKLGADVGDVNSEGNTIVAEREVEGGRIAEY